MQKNIESILEFFKPLKKANLASPENASKKNNNTYTEDPAGLMVSIIKNAHSEYKVEIANYLAARSAALNTERPRRKAWAEICAKAMTDGIVFSETEKRIDRICNKEFKIIDFNSQKENPEKTDLFNKAWFYDWLRYTIEAKIYGCSLPYIQSIENGFIKNIDLVDRKHVIPELNGFLPDLNGDKIISWLNPPFSQYAMPVGKPAQLGLMDAIMPLYILRKHSWANWDQFEELYGVPIRIAKTASTDPKVKAAITDWLRDMGSANYGLFPQDTNLEVLENKQTDAFQVFLQKITSTKEEISLIINRQFETSSTSGSRAKAETVVSSTQDELTLADLRFLYFEINDKLMYILAGIGYPINPEMDVFQWHVPENLKEKIDIFTGVSNLGFELDPVQVEEVFDVKILGKKEIANPFDWGNGGNEPKK